MITEHAVFEVPEGRQTEFETVFEKAKEFIRTSKGCHSVRLLRGHEAPNQYLLLVEWDSVEDHMVGFRESENFVSWRALVGPIWTVLQPPTHFTEVASA
jgi:heme-degrading monooxygenase HmoA